ncbi:MAG: YcaO-like family protein [Nanoarchaeota archaeon]
MLNFILKKNSKNDDKKPAIIIKPIEISDKHNTIIGSEVNDPYLVIDWMKKNNVYNAELIVPVLEELKKYKNKGFFRKIKASFYNFYLNNYVRSKLESKNPVPLIKNPNENVENLNFVSIKELYNSFYSLEESIRPYAENNLEKIKRILSNLGNLVIGKIEENLNQKYKEIIGSGLYFDEKSGLRLINVVFSSGKGLSIHQAIHSFTGELFEKLNLFSLNDYINKTEKIEGKDIFKLLNGKIDGELLLKGKYTSLIDDNENIVPIFLIQMDNNNFFENHALFLNKYGIKGLGVGLNKENAKYHSLTETIEKFYVFNVVKNIDNLDLLLKNYDIYLLKSNEFEDLIPLFVPKKYLVPTIIAYNQGLVSGGSDLKESIALTRALNEAYSVYRMQNRNKEEHYSIINKLKEKGVKVYDFEELKEILNKDFSSGNIKEDIKRIEEILKANKFSYITVNASKYKDFTFYYSLIFDLI